MVYVRISIFIKFGLYLLWFFFKKTQDILPWTHSRVKARHGLTPLIALPWAGVKGEGVAGRLGPQAVSRELVQTTVRAGKGGWRVSRREPSEFPASFGIHLPLSLCSLFLNLKDEGSILSSDTTNFFFVLYKYELLFHWEMFFKLLLFI